MAAEKKTAREERRAKMVRIIAILACAALLLTAVLPYLSGLRR